jgi:anti-sigma factor RsiW
MMECSHIRPQLEEHRRGELPPDAAALVDAHLARCPACRRLRDEDQALAALVGALDRPPAPAALRRRVERLALPPRGVRAWLARPWVAAALAAVVVAAALGPWVRLGPDRPDAVEALIQSGVAEHRRILLQLEIGAEAAPDVPQLFERVRSLTDVKLPQVFAGVGELKLVTARPTVIQNRKSAAAALRYPTSPLVTYFVLLGKDLPMPTKGRVQIEQYRPYQRQVDEFSVIYWKQGDLAYLMVSGLDTPHTQQLFLKMRKAL